MSKQNDSQLASDKPRQKRRRLTPEQRSAEILEAATRLISERGFNGVSLQTVAEACGMTVPGLLHYVKSKDGLLVAVLAHRDEVDLAEVGIVPRDSTKQAARWHLDRLMRRNASQPEIVQLYTVLNAESLNPDHPAHKYFNRRYVDSFEVFRSLLSAEYENADQLARDAIAAMDGVQMQWLRFGEYTDLEELWSRMADAIFASAQPLSASPLPMTDGYR